MAWDKSNSVCTELALDPAESGLVIENRDYKAFLETALKKYRPAGTEEEMLVRQIAALHAGLFQVCKLRGDLLLSRLAELEECIHDHKMPSISKNIGLLEHMTAEMCDELGKRTARLREMQVKRRQIR